MAPTVSSVQIYLFLLNSMAILLEISILNDFRKRLAYRLCGIFDLSGMMIEIIDDEIVVCWNDKSGTVSRHVNLFLFT